MNNRDGKNKILLVFATFVVVFITVAGLVVLNFLLFKPVVRALSGDYNRSDASLSVDDWNFLDEDFIGKDGDTMTGGLNMDSVSLTGIVTDPGDSGSLASVGFVNSRVDSALGGTAYVNWGRGDCGGDTLLYGGYAFGTIYTQTSGGYNDICLQMPSDGEITYSGTYSDSLVPALSSGSIWLSNPAFNPLRSFIKCAVCYRNRSACYVNYGTDSCSTAPFTIKAYDGILAAGISESHAMSRDRKCLNQNFDNTAGASTMGWSAPWYGSRVENTFGQAGYMPLRFTKCALCCN